MSKTLLVSAFCVPGILTVSLLSTFYEKSPVSGRFRFIPFDKPLERQIARKLQKTWGQKTLLRHLHIENKQIESVWNEIKLTTNLPQNGKVFILDTNENIFQIFHTGDLYVSKSVLGTMDENKTRDLLMHQAAHVVLKHAQENLLCSKIFAVLLAYLCRNNHHFHYVLKNYQLFPRYTEIQEAEANQFVASLSQKYIPHICTHSLIVNN